MGIFREHSVGPARTPINIHKELPAPKPKSTPSCFVPLLSFRPRFACSSLPNQCHHNVIYVITNITHTPEPLILWLSVQLAPENALPQATGHLLIVQSNGCSVHLKGLCSWSFGNTAPACFSESPFSFWFFLLDLFTDYPLKIGFPCGSGLGLFCFPHSSYF